MFAEYKPKIVTNISEIHVVYNVCDNTNQHQTLGKITLNRYEYLQHNTMFSEIHTADVLTKVSQLIEATHDDLPCILKGEF